MASKRRPRKIDASPQVFEKLDISDSDKKVSAVKSKGKVKTYVNGKKVK